MTGQHTMELMTLLQVEYPASFRGLDKRQMAAKIAFWAAEFAAEDYGAVMAAVHALMRSGRQWAPTAGEILEKMRELTAPEELPETAVLAMISKAAANSAYNAEAEFAKLPPEVQEIVYSPTQLREWGQMEAQTFQSVIGSFVMKSYRTGIKRARERAALPENVRELIGGISDKLSLGEFTGKGRVSDGN